MHARTPGRNIVVTGWFPDFGRSYPCASSLAVTYAHLIRYSSGGCCGVSPHSQLSASYRRTLKQQHCIISGRRLQ